MGFWRYLLRVLKKFDGCAGDISALNRRYLMGVLEIFDGCPGDI